MTTLEKIQQFEGRNYTLYRALVRTLTAEQVCDLFPYALEQDPQRRRACIQRLSETGEEEFTSAHRVLVHWLLAQIDKPDCKSRSSCGFALCELCRVAPKELRAEILDALLHSRLKVNRARAARLLRDHGVGQYAQTVVALWERYREEDFSRLIIDHLPVRIVREHFDSLIQLVEPWLAARMVLRLVDEFPEVLGLLRQVYPVRYLYCVVKLGRTVTDVEAFDIAPRWDSFDEHGLYLWCLGELGKTDLLLKLHAEQDPQWSFIQG